MQTAVSEIQRLRQEFGWLGPHEVTTNCEAEDVASISYPTNGIHLLSDHASNSYWAKHRGNIISSAVKRHERETLWEIGAGAGDVSRDLHENGICVVAVEPMQIGTRTLRERGIFAYCATLAELQLPSGSLPSIGAFDVIEHLEDPAPLIAEAKRVLEPEGRLFLTVPAHPFLWSTEDDLSGHFRRYTRKSLISLLASGGFEVVEITHFFSFLVLPAFIVRRIAPRFRSGDRRDFDREIVKQLQPRRSVDRILQLLGRLEEKFFSHYSLPFGLSILAVASPKVEEVQA